MLILAFILLVYQVTTQFSTLPTWIGNPYLETDSYQVITDFQTVSQSGAANITFAQTYSAPPQVAFGIITYSGRLFFYQGNDGLFDEDFFMRTVRVTETLAELYIFMQGATNIRILYVMYLAVHPDFLYHLNSFNDIEANYSTNGALSLHPINTNTTQVRVFTNYINYTQLCERINARHKYFGSDLAKNKIAVYLSGIFNYVNNKDLPEIKFDILTEAVNASFFKLEVTVSAIYQIDLLRLSFITMDIANIQTSKEYTIVYNTQRYYFDQDYYISLEKEFFGDVFIGMLDFNTQSPRCTIDFNLVFQPSNSRIVVKKSVPHQGSLYPNCGLKSARLVTFYMKTWFCPDPFYYFNLQTDMCDDYCASYFYGNKTAGQCRSCPLGCVRCDPLNPDTCTLCDPTNDFRELINGKCECMVGFYQQISSDVICTSCETVVGQCSKCSLTSNFTCQACNTGWYLDSNGLCQACQIVGCIDCASLNQCTLCDISSNYTLLSDKKCSQCPVQCSCDGYFLPKILDPETGIQYCSTVCGDGKLREKEQCDDGNQDDGDGCSSKCEIQNYWSCQNNGQNLTCCVIKEQEMYLRVDSIIKSKGQNAFEMELTLFPYLPFLTSQKLLSSLNITLSGIPTTKQQLTVSNTQRIRLKYYYDSHVQKKQCNITLKISLKQDSNQNCSMQVQTSMKFYPESSNNQPLMFFDAQNYQRQQKTDKIIKLMMYASYGILALSAIPCKIVGLQLFGVLQLAYFSLAEISNLNLMMVPFIGFSSANGFNPNIFSSQNNLPQKIKSIEYDSLFMNNCGVMLGLMLIEIIIGFLLYFPSVFNEKSKWLSNISRRLLKEGFLTLIVFNAFNFAFATGIHFKYSDSNQSTYLLNSILAIFSLLAPLIMVFLLIFAESKDFGEFKDKFKKQPVSQLYFVVTILYRYFLGYFMAVKSENELGSLVVIMFSLLFILYNFVNLPFKSAMHNYRANVCHLSQLGILVVANYYESMKATTDEETKSFIFSPAYFQLGLIILALILSVVGLLFQFHKFVRGFFRNKVYNESLKNLGTQESFEINENYLDEASKKKMKDSEQQMSHQERVRKGRNNKSKSKRSIQNEIYFSQYLE